MFEIDDKNDKMQVFYEELTCYWIKSKKAERKTQSTGELSGKFTISSIWFHEDFFQ